MGWLEWLSRRRRPAHSDPLDVRRRGESAAEHLRAGAPYRHRVDRPLLFGTFHGGMDVALDRVYASTVNNSTVHVVTPTEHYGTSMGTQVEQIAEIIRSADPHLAGLVLFLPRDDHQDGSFLVPLFAIARQATPIGQGRLIVMADRDPAVDHTRTGDVATRYAATDYGHCNPQDLADALALPVAELALLMPEIHQRAAATPGWWEACAVANERSEAAYTNFMAILREWDLE